MIDLVDVIMVETDVGFGLVCEIATENNVVIEPADKIATDFAVEMEPGYFANSDVQMDDSFANDYSIYYSPF